MRELEYAIRRLRGSPMFTIAATLTLAISIGATASVFGVVDGVLLKAFPFATRSCPDALGDATRNGPPATCHGGAGELLRVGGPKPQLLGHRRICDGFVDDRDAAQDAERVNGSRSRRTISQVLGITPILGRPLHGYEWPARGRPQLRLLAAAIWRLAIRPWSATDARQRE